MGDYTGYLMDGYAGYINVQVGFVALMVIGSSYKNFS